jgi:hypothetical protein
MNFRLLIDAAMAQKLKVATHELIIQLANHELR